MYICKTSLLFLSSLCDTSILSFSLMKEAILQRLSKSLCSALILLLNSYWWKEIHLLSNLTPGVCFLTPCYPSGNRCPHYGTVVSIPLPLEQHKQQQRHITYQTSKTLRMLRDSAEKESWHEFGHGLSNRTGNWWLSFLFLFHVSQVDPC